MGVTGLWTVVQPCARPIKLETLNRKRLAVDASIWIYQFLKAVRDKEGNALRNSHVVGFFRRICKLLYFGIKPVFIFDGGAPVLKRQTIAGRKKRREGRREDATRTAGKLLAVQMQRIAEDEAETRRREKKRRQEEEEQVTETPVYADEVLMSEKERQQARRFKKKDAYHLPNLEVSLEEMGAPNDPRIMSQEELEEYARQFHQGQDINLYDFSKIDFDGPFFLSLPATDRYNILNAARLRSRLRMGYSKEQLDVMFPNRMDFSKFQIDRVKERNDLTQRLMNINGMNGEEAFFNSGQRIAGERGKEYVLVKDSQHEGGWVLGVVGNKDEGNEEKPIDVDRYGQPEYPSGSEDMSSEEDFEDVPIEGLNRLPKLPFLENGVFDESLERFQEDSNLQRALFESQKAAAMKHNAQAEDDALFVQSDNNVLLPRQNQDAGLFDEVEDDDLEKAIALSLQPDGDHEHGEDVPDIPINRPKTTVAPPPVPVIDLPAESEEDSDEMDFSAAMTQTKVAKNKPRPANPFSGPLPFESIQLNKISKPDDQSKKLDENAGGFVKESSKEKKKGEPLPPWFVGEHTNEEFIVDRTPDNCITQDAKNQDEPNILFSRRSPEIVNVDELPDTKEVVAIDDEPEKQEKPQIDTHVEIPPVEIETTENNQQDSVSALLDVEKAEADPLDKPEVPEAPAAAIVEETAYDKDEEQEPLVQGQAVPAEFSPEPQSSPEPDFEDVLTEAPAPAPAPAPDPLPVEADNITVVAHQNIEPGAEAAPPMEYFVEDEGEFSDPEDEDLMRQLAAEGEEYVRFAQSLNAAAPANKDAFDYEQELKQLRSQHRKDQRDADEVTQIMINECQELLRLFGLPYVTAPMEAEAQCAKLVELGLVDGIVTDDSDVFLFGGTRVYKNMFNQAKFVECYMSSQLEKELSLPRHKLINFAHLLGSDYTEGIPGIGPVTAKDILTEFSDLQEFRDWWTQVQMGVNRPDDAHSAFRKKFRKKASKIFLPPVFPDQRVDEAYLEPEVDADPSQFQWGEVDMDGLRRFLMSTIGWSPERTDEVLLPVIRDRNRRQQEGTQSNITQFMSGTQGVGAFAPLVRGSGPTSRRGRGQGRAQKDTRAPTGRRGTSSSQDHDHDHGHNQEQSQMSAVPGATGKRGQSTAGGGRKKQKT
ncbi:DNA repair protein rad13 [Penicillium argentinense]|uniref:DNA repair protein rad13 n=1 Tax=Penicillium argentinense TaxID=1131581 RepID=A0A9W9FN18_9EURO|nr:DNA repair protein rad13 [Penicillium argentinense]KAJ5103251.1 DNA repair protein rad13 [Penicillium argentinense]